MIGPGALAVLEEKVRQCRLELAQAYGVEYSATSLQLDGILQSDATPFRLAARRLAARRSYAMAYETAYAHVDAVHRGPAPWLPK